MLLVPAIPEQYVYAARKDPQRRRGSGLEALGRHENFTLAGLAEHHAGARRAAYVHAKLMIVDDVWATVGSCNLHPNSLGGHTEMNASIWDAALARDLRCRLFAQHLGVDTASLDDRAALRQFRDIARGNRHQDGEPRAGLAGADFRFVAGDLRQEIGREARSDVTRGLT